MLFDLIGAASGGSVSNVGKSARVIVVNRRNKMHTLEQLGTSEGATTRMHEIERDLELLSFTAWCEKYDVPESFVSG